MALQFVKGDLSRFYYFSNKKNKRAHVFGVLLNTLNPRFCPVFLYRFSCGLQKYKLKPLAKLVSLFNFVFFGIEISSRCEIGEGLFFPHTVGTVIGAHSIGKNAVIYQGVTLGAKQLDMAYDESLRPKIGNNVVIGAGAKVLGGITIGDNVVIAANSVVLESLDNNSMVGGIPAKLIKKIEEPLYGSN